MDAISDFLVSTLSLGVVFYEQSLDDYTKPPLRSRFTNSVPLKQIPRVKRFNIEYVQPFNLMLLLLLLLLS